MGVSASVQPVARPHPNPPLKGRALLGSTQRCHGLTPHKPPRPPFGDGAHPFGKILGSHQLGLLGQLMVGRRLDQRPQISAQRPPGRCHRQWRRRGDLVRQGQRRRLQRLRRYQLVDQPQRSASSPRMRRPVSSIIAARWRPITRSSTAEMPKPGCRPNCTKFATKRASGVATRKSATSASPSPAPTAAPAPLRPPASPPRTIAPPPCRTAARTGRQGVRYRVRIDQIRARTKYPTFRSKQDGANRGFESTSSNASANCEMVPSPR